MSLRRTSVIGVLVALLLGPTAALATPRPEGLRVVGGGEGWRSEQLFSLRWANPEPVAAVHYRLLGPSGQTVIGDTRVLGSATALDHVTLPAAAGAYTTEVWLEGHDGSLGEPSAVTLRFDNVAPGPVEAIAPMGWLGRSSFPYALRLSHPTGPQPLSGIRGYAVVIDASAIGHPCPGGRCGEGDVDSHGGIDADTVSVAALPEGLSYAHAVAVSGSGMASANAGSTPIRVDTTYPQTILAGVTEGWRNEPVTLTARAEDAHSGMAPGRPGIEPYTAIRVDGAAPAIATGGSVSTTVIGSGIHTVAYYARDAAGNVDDGATVNGRTNRAPATAVVKIDREPPAVAFAAGQDPDDPELIEARLADAGAGIDSARGSISMRRLGSSERFRPLPTRVTESVLRARWDSDEAPAGEYEFRATAYDRAGNAATSGSRVNGAPMRLRGPIKLQLRLSADSGERPLRHGRGTWFDGRLLVGRRTPLEDVAVRVVERFAPGAIPTARVTTVRSGADGRFGLRLPPGPSRSVTAEVSPTATSRGATSEPLVLSVASRLSLRVSARVARVGGAPVVFRGRLAHGGAAIPSEGKSVQLQFRLRGEPWSEFRTVRSNRLGRFRYAYRFSDDDSRGVRFQFRAYAPEQAGWPFEPAGSLPVTVRGF